MKTATAQSFDPIERRQYIGASEVAAVMGHDKWRSPLDVYNSKLGLTPDFEGNNHTERGNRLEAIAADYYTEQTGVKLRRRTEAFTHPQMLFFVGHVDRIAVAEKRVVEVKCPSVAAFRRMQREGLPESFIIQAQALMGLTGYPVLTWVVFCADLWDAVTFDIDFDADIYRAIEIAVKVFWSRVESKVPPIATQDDEDKLELAQVGGQDITVRDDETFTNAVTMLAEAKQILADGKELEDLAKKAVKDAVENECGVYEGGGYRLNLTATKGRSSFDKDLLKAEHPTIDLARYTKAGKPGTQITIFKTNSTGE